MSQTEQPSPGAPSAPASDDNKVIPFPGAFLPLTGDQEPKDFSDSANPKSRIENPKSNVGEADVYDEHDRLVMLTPCYGGQQSSLFRDSLHVAQTTAPRANFRCADGKVRSMPILAMGINLPGDSHIDRARNNIIHDALATPYRNFLFCDADQPFEPSDIAITWVRLMSGIRVIGGSVALKTIRTVFACNTEGNTKTPGPDGLLPGRDTGTGWMGFRRDVLDEIRTRWPAYVRSRIAALLPADLCHLTSDICQALASCGLSADISYVANQGTPHAGQTIHAYFASGVAHRDGAGDWLSEDWMFCHRCKLLGIPIKIDPLIRIKHLGPMLYPPDPKELIEAALQAVSGKNPPFNRGLCSAAEQVLTALHKDIHEASISILHPTRRGAQALKIRELWLSRCSNPKNIEYIISVDPDDTASIAALKDVPDVVIALPSPCSLLPAPAGPGVVAAINYAAALAEGRVLIMAADDCEPPQDWDKLILAALKGQFHEPRLLWTSDGYTDQPVITHPIMTRALYEAQGYFFCPEYPHLFCDTELTHRAQQAGQIIDARHIVLRHQHPMFTGAAADALHRERNSPAAFAAGQAIFMRRNSSAPNIFGPVDFADFYRQQVEQAPVSATFAELGAWLGVSAVCMLSAIQRSGKAIAFRTYDTFAQRPTWKDEIAYIKTAGGTVEAACRHTIRTRTGLDPAHIVHNCDSAAAASRYADASVHFCFIDADHTEPAVRRDIEAWLPKIKPGGTLAGHDYDMPSVARAVTALLGDKYTIQHEGKVWYVRLP